MNISDGRDAALLSTLAHGLDGACLDLHSDPDHHRSVFTLVGEEAPLILASAAVQMLDIGLHAGVHPRIGVVDVVPFIPLHGSSLDDAVAARDRFASWAATHLEVPVFLYGPERTLPDIRRRAWRDLAPDIGPTSPHPGAGAMCVGARLPLIAYNVWLDGVDLERTKKIAAEIRGPHVRTLGLQVGSSTQVSMNLVAPDNVGPDVVFDAVSERAPISRAELVGLVPAATLASIPRSRWEELDLAVNRTIEWRLANPPEAGSL